MDKYINDEDRIVIGVREWAIQTVLGDKWIESNLVKDVRDRGTTESVVKIAEELEEYVLGGITSKEIKV